MKNFVSVNCKYYKHSNASGELGHVDRLFHENINSFAEYTKYNFGSEFCSFEKYKEINQRRINVTGKNIRKDSNTYLDFVVAFSLHQWELLEKKHGIIKLQKAMKIMMKNFMAEMKKEHGLEPISNKFHLDEGHIKQLKAYQNQQERIKNGLLKEDEVIIEKSSLIRNIHAHVTFYNFDFKQKKSPLRKMTKSTFSNFQDIAGRSFNKAGFYRGVAKELSKKSHSEKIGFVEQKLKSKKLTLNFIEEDIEKKEAELHHLKNDIAESKSLFESLKNDINGLFNHFKLSISKYAKNLLNLDINAIDENIEQLQQIAEETSKIAPESAKAMGDETHSIAARLKRIGFGKKIKP